MHGNEEAFRSGISGFLGWYYLCCALLNGVAAFYCWENRKNKNLGINWLIVALIFTIIAPLAFSGILIGLPGVAKNLLDQMMANAFVYSAVTLFGLVGLFFTRRYWVPPAFAWGLFNLSLLFLGLSIVDMEFAAIVTKPDNVPIVAMLFLLGYFTWLATYRAVQNDDRSEQGLPPLEAEDNEKILVWPDLVYTEMICMIVVTAILILWGIGLQAPLEEPASSVKTPNPSKAPWYFLGLQEMLVYFDPWMAGVVLPSLVVFGLMAIPFLDFNPKGNGYYTIKERPFAYAVFQIGFLELWVTLIVMGTFLRGPNWNLFGPYEIWDPHKVEALNNVDLSQYFWVQWLGMQMPKAPEEAGMLAKILTICYRESPGILVTIGYLLVMPPVMAMTVFRKIFAKMGFIRFMVMSNLLLMMALLPIKMLLRWTFNLKYIIAIPEYFLNL